MCGIAGLVSISEGAKSSIALDSRYMAASLQHRGPDSDSYWLDSKSGVSLVHTRLSIFDLTSAGGQPMHSHNGRYTIVFNGEIYNWISLRSQFFSDKSNSFWNSSSDTELLLELISTLGLLDTLPLLDGMFAFALWDHHDSTLCLVRDRVGEKPLYYGHVGSYFCFASELKAIKAIPSHNLTINYNAASLMIRYGYVPAPFSIFNGIYKLSPGSFLKIKNTSACVLPDIQTWWKSPLPSSYVSDHLSYLSDHNKISELDNVLTSVISNQMLSDVPIGSFLSGGIDSSLVTAIMQKQSSTPIKSYTIRFAESGYDESSYASSIAEYLGTEHQNHLVTASDAQNIIPHLPIIYDEPFADSSQIPTALLSSLTSNHVSVCLTGDGGDEMFGGYNRYIWANTLSRNIGFYPLTIRKCIGHLFTLLPASQWDNVFSCLQPLLPSSCKVSNPGDKLHKLASILHFTSNQDLYFLLISTWRDSLPFSNSYLVDDPILEYASSFDFTEFISSMISIDTHYYLPDDILVKVDRSSMSNGLETRAPFLDRNILQFSSSLDLSFKIRNSEPKWILHQLLSRYLPPSLFNRPKQGFAIPLDSWLRGPLREWSEDLLFDPSYYSDGFLDISKIRHQWNRFLKGHNNQHSLWNVLMFLAWRRAWD